MRRWPRTPRLVAAAVCAVVGAARGARVDAGAAELCSDAPPGEVGRGAPSPITGALPLDLEFRVLRLVPAPPQVATSLGSGTLLLLHLGGGKRRLRGGTPAGRTTGIRFSPEGSRIVTAHAQGVCAVWSAATARLLREWRCAGWDRIIYEIHVFPGGKKALTLTSEPRVVIWDVASGEALHRLDTGDAHHRVGRITRCGGHVVTGVGIYEAMRVILWGAEGGTHIRNFEHGAEMVRMLYLDPLGRRLITACHHSVFIWGLASGTLEWLLPVSGQPIFNIAVSELGDTLAASTMDSRVLLWHRGAGGWRLNRSLLANETVFALALAHHGRLVVAFTPLRGLVWDAASGRLLHRLTDVAGERGEVRLVLIASEGNTVAVCGGDVLGRSSLRTTIWDARRGRRLNTLPAEVSEEAPSTRADTVGWPGCSVALSPATSMLEYVRALR